MACGQSGAGGGRARGAQRGAGARHGRAPAYARHRDAAGLRAASPRRRASADRRAAVRRGALSRSWSYRAFRKSVKQCLAMLREACLRQAPQHESEQAAKPHPESLAENEAFPVSTLSRRCFTQAVIPESRARVFLILIESFWIPLGVDL